MDFSRALRDKKRPPPSPMASEEGYGEDDDDGEEMPDAAELALTFHKEASAGNGEAATDALRAFVLLVMEEE